MQSKRDWRNDGRAGVPISRLSGELEPGLLTAELGREGRAYANKRGDGPDLFLKTLTPRPPNYNAVDKPRKYFK